MPACSNCGGDNRAGAKFCGKCGSPLALACPSCGSPYAPGDVFCDECGTSLGGGAPAAAPPAPSAPPSPELVAERRLVSVLFADLVGFTTLSEARDAEEVRDLLSRYFDTCRRLIELYGGTVEKFIGDAVMAVWGTPVATEDDAERAVRAALDLVAAVHALGQEVGAEGLQARAGVLTGEAAVSLSAAGEGMIAGDMVNTASRAQSVAEPGSVFVGASTRRATQNTIVYESAGSFELKGKAQETPLWRALRVVSGRGGALKTEGLESPFVGRDRELRQIKDLFHVCAEEGRAQLVSVTGIAGIGKSRLAWEFYKYFDGIAQGLYWHRGRCLAYGEGVTYWALADMVRWRCGIAEDEQEDDALRKLEATLEEHLLDPEERRFVQPRLAHLLALGDDATHARPELFAAWRLFFERLADAYPTVLVFEDVQWADSSLLDFIEYLLEWSRDKPLLVITLARPELLEKRPTWGAGQRNFTSSYLEPLSEQAMHELLIGVVPGLPPSLRKQILDRAEGVPLYAVETVRMLLDRGLLVQDGSVYSVVGEVATLDVPETLHALIAARLDGLRSEERRVLGDAAVLGKTFSPQALAALSGLAGGPLEELLAGLVRREVLGLQSDPRSPEQGQYTFLQDLLRRVAYETLARKKRREKHLAAAEYLSVSHDEAEVAEVIAFHLLEAYRIDLGAADADSLRTRAYHALLRAGERAASLAAAAEGRRYFEQAAELAVEPVDEAAALTRAGEMANVAAEYRHARTLLERAIELYEGVGDTHTAARASCVLAYAEQGQGQLEAAIARMEQAHAVIGEDEPSADLAFLLMRLGRAHAMAGSPDKGAEWNERGLGLAETLELPEQLVLGWDTKAVLVSERHPAEARSLFQLALDTALASELYDAASRACAGLSELAFRDDRYGDSLAHLDQAHQLALRIGNRGLEWFSVSEATYALTMLGRWDEALARLADIPDDLIGKDSSLAGPLSGVLELLLYRGRIEEARELLARYDDLYARSAGDVQTQGAYRAALAGVRLAEGKPEDAMAAAEQVFAARETLGIGSQNVKLGFLHALEAALALGETAKTRELLDALEALPRGLRPPLLEAVALRFRAQLEPGDPGADPLFIEAAMEFRALGLPFHLAVVELEHAEWLTRQGRAADAEPLFADARETFARLGATPWIDRVDRAVGAPASPSRKAASREA